MFILALQLSTPHQLSSALHLAAQGVNPPPPLWIGAREPRLWKNIGVWEKISRKKHDMYIVSLTAKHLISGKDFMVTMLL